MIIAFIAYLAVVHYRNMYTERRNREIVKKEVELNLRKKTLVNTLASFRL
jgi:hypothetical protein